MIHSFRSIIPVCLLISILGSASAKANQIYLSDARIETLKKRVEERQEPNYSAWLGVRKQADLALRATDPVVPAQLFSLSPYRDLAKHNENKKSNTLGRDAHAAFRMALAYRITGEARYAVGAVKILNAWASRLKKIDARRENTSLNVCAFMPCFSIAADLLEKSSAFTADEQNRFRDFLKHVVVASDSAGLCMKRRNNWANFGTLLAMTAGRYLNDQDLFNKGVTRWKELIDSQMDAEGTLMEEVTRKGNNDVPGSMGLWYSNFTLFPATLAAEVARANGVDLYGYVSPSKKSLRLAYEKLIPWIRDPATFTYYQGTNDPAKLTGVYLIPYFEMLTLRWPNADALAILKAHRPVKTNHCIPDETFTHGDLP